MSIIEQLNAKSSKKGTLITIFIIIGIFVISISVLIFYLTTNNIKNEASRMFEKPYSMLKEFDSQTNFLSKQNMEKDLIAQLDKVILKYPNTISGERASFYKAYVYYNTENYENAIKQFKLFINKYKKSYLLNKAYYFLSYCYSDTKKYDEAIKILEIFETKLKNNEFSPLSIYRIGNLYELKGDKNNAIKYYDKVIKDYSKSSIKATAEKRMLLLKNDIKL